MLEPLNSLRMRAERGGEHISGAERLVTFEQLETVAVEMLQRALQHPRGQAEQVSLRVEPVASEKLQSGCLPDLQNNLVTHWQHGRKLASELLRGAGVSDIAASRAICMLENGPAPDGRNMRGAMLIDCYTGERLEADPARGVRVSRMDLSGPARAELIPLLKAHDLCNQHVMEALTLAAKVISAPGMVAEVCWSDDPDYQAGYVASVSGGYQRISAMKPPGERVGGRAFFVDRQQVQIASLVDWLERQPFLVEQIGSIRQARQWRNDP